MIKGENGVIDNVMEHVGGELGSKVVIQDEAAVRLKAKRTGNQVLDCGFRIADSGNQDSRLRSRDPEIDVDCRKQNQVTN